MKNVKVLLGVFTGLVFLVLVGGLFLPGSWKIERSTVVSAEPEAVFWCVNTYEGWATWSLWAADLYPDLSFSPGDGPRAGAGTIVTWMTGEEPAGELVIQESTPNERVAYSMVFVDGGEAMNGTMTLAPAEGGVLVTWAEQGEIGMNPLARYMALASRGAVAEHFDKGLVSLGEAAVAHAERLAEEAARSRDVDPEVEEVFDGGGATYEGN